MEKSKLGISINLFAAMLYFLGIGGNSLVIAVAAGYILLFESSERLKKTAVKALIITVFLSILTLLITYLVSLSAQIFNALSSYSLFSRDILTNPTNYYRTYIFQFIQAVVSNIDSVMRILQLLILVICGFRTYKEKDIKIKWIDKILDNHLNG